MLWLRHHRHRAELLDVRMDPPSGPDPVDRALPSHGLFAGKAAGGRPGEGGDPPGATWRPYTVRRIVIKRTLTGERPRSARGSAPLDAAVPAVDRRTPIDSFTVWNNQL